jgi:hypothetical protein
MSRVADYSTGFPGAEALKKTGYVGAVRYIGTPGNRKCTTAAELRDFTAHRLGMGLVFEQTAGQWRNGYDQGVRDARAARAHADQVGYPQNRPIYFAIDQDVVTQAEFQAMDRYADGWAAVLTHGLCGPYGEYDVVARCMNRGFVWGWQCRAWSGNRTYPHNHLTVAQLYQYYGHPESGPGGTAGGNLVVNGIECDTNEVLQADWGGHLTEVEDMPTPKEFWDAELINEADNHPGEAKKWLIDANAHAFEAKNNARAAAVGVDRIESVLKALDAKITTGFKDLSDDESKIIAAVRSMPTGGEVGPEDVAALATQLGALLPPAVVAALARQLSGVTTQES